MLSILGITIPIFFLIALGFAAVRKGMLARAETRGLGTFVITFALPPLLFKALASRPLAHLVNLDLLAAYALASLTVAAVILVFAQLAMSRGLETAAIMAMGASMSNSAFMGFPIAQQLIGTEASTALAHYLVVENLIMLPLLLLLADLGKGPGTRVLHSLFAILRGLLHNPMIIAILAGGLFSLLDLQLPVPVGRALDMLSAASAPVALFYIGCVLAGLNFKGMASDIGSIVAGKLILHPLAITLAFLLVPVSGTSLKTAFIVNAGMPMLSIYPILGQKYGKEGLCAAALVATTVISFFTISILLWITR